MCVWSRHGMPVICHLSVLWAVAVKWFWCDTSESFKLRLRKKEWERVCVCVCELGAWPSIH